VSDEVLGGRYRLEALIGQGGMARVYRAQDLQLDRTVAVKILSGQLAHDPSFVERFRRESKTAAKLNNPNIVGVYDSGAEDHTDYIVMELVEGRTLDEFLAGGGRLSPVRSVELLENVAGALAYAHQRGVIHRDIKPGNIMVTREGQVKVMDFGIARLTTTKETLAETATVLGTAAYLSPEQAQGEPVDARSDIYSLGCVSYELLTGSQPFTGDTAVAVAYKHVQETPPPPSSLNPELTPQVDAVVMKAMAKNPENRYQTAQEFRDDLERLRTGRQVSATPILPADAATQAIQRPGTDQTQVMLPNGDEEKGRNWAVGILVALAIIAVVGGGAFLLVRSLGDNAPPTPQVTVPRVVDMTLADATAQLKKFNLVVAQPIEYQVDAGKPGIVLSQDPQNGARVDRGSPVTLTVSKVAAPQTIPSVMGQSKDQAQQTLEGDPFDFQVTITRQPSTTVARTFAIGTSPPEGKTLKKGGQITLFISSGKPPPSTVTVPDVTCLGTSKANNTLEGAGLSMQIVGERPANPSCPQGNKVSQQSPAAGTTIARNSVVKVWTNAKPTSPPPT
jgi:eukaryotic-like serine/threonine-protein kinase